MTLIGKLESLRTDGLIDELKATGSEWTAGSL